MKEKEALMMLFKLTGGIDSNDASSPEKEIPALSEKEDTQVFARNEMEIEATDEVSCYVG